MKQRYESLNGLRAIACFGIVLMHVRSNMVIKPNPNFVMTNIIGFTADFVSMFMMVSAFGLCCGYYERFKSGTISLNDFYSKRYTRILPFFALLSVIDAVLCLISEHFTMSETLVGELWEAFANVVFFCFILLSSCERNEFWKS